MGVAVITWLNKRPFPLQVGLADEVLEILSLLGEVVILYTISRSLSNGRDGGDVAERREGRDGEIGGEKKREGVREGRERKAGGGGGRDER